MTTHFLPENEVHIWVANLDISLRQIQQLTTILSEDEQLRAERFYFEQHKNRFIVARGILRTILGNYLNTAPEQLQFSYSDKGKPALANATLEFNLSHSQDIALYAFTRQGKIGIDVEYLRSLQDAEKIAERFFSSQEYNRLSLLNSEEQQQEFFRLWTGKEAYLKAIGEGLSGNLAQIEVINNKEKSVSLLQIQGISLDNWYLHNFIPQPDYMASFAVENISTNTLIIRNFQANCLIT